jgi:hypothetical protein
VACHELACREGHVKKGFLLVLLPIVGYIAGGVVLHALIFREGPIPAEMYPRPVAVLENLTGRVRAARGELAAFACRTLPLLCTQMLTRHWLPHTLALRGARR